MSLIGNVDTPASYVADYMQACVGMLGIPAGGFTADIEAFGATNEFNVESLYAAMLNSSIGRSIYAPGSSNATFAAKLVEKLGGSLLSDDAEAWALDWAEAQLDAGMSRAALAMAVVEAVSAVDTADENFGTVALQFANRIEVANYYTFSSTSPSTSVSTLTSALSTVTNTSDVSTTAKIVAILEANPSGGTSTGQTFTLTTGIDTPAGSSGNDTIIGDMTTTATLNASDQITGGAGTDTLKMYGVTAALFLTNTPLTMTGLETIQIANAVDAGVYNFSGLTKAATGLTTIQFDNASAVGANAITTTAGQGLSLATGSGGVASAATTIWAASATDTTLNLTLNGYQGGSGVTPIGLTVTGAAATTLNITSTGAANKVGVAATTYFTGPTTVLTHNVSGDKALTYVLAAADAAALTSINASTSTGGVNADVRAGTAKIGFSFTGGSGNDSITFKDDAFTTLTAGTQLVGGEGTDKIGILDTALTATELGKINAATGFEVLGLNAAITLDASQLTSIKSFSIDTAGLTQTISNMAAGSTVSITKATTSETLGTAIGVTETTVSIGSATAAGFTVGTLVVTGITNVALASIGTSANTITTLTNSDNSTFTVTGSAGLTATLSAGTAIGSKLDGTAMTGVATFVGSTIIASGDILIGGSAADFLTGGRGADTMTGNGGADTFIFAATQDANTNGTTFGTNFDTITDFVVGTDKLQFTTVTDVVSVQQAAVQSAVTALAASATSTQIATAMATANTTNLGVSFAVFGGNTYVLYEEVGASTGDVTDDVFIKLTGVTTAPTFAADVIA